MGKLVDLDVLTEDAGEIIVEQYKGRIRLDLPRIVEKYRSGITSYLQNVEKQRRAAAKLMAHLLALRDVGVSEKYKEVMAEVARKRREYLKLLLPVGASVEKKPVYAIAK